MTVTIWKGDVMDGLRQMYDDSVDCVVTSPPYWGLRDYGVDGQIGLEKSLGEHLDRMVEVFAEIRRVLKPTGTCWVNYGDCYATTPNGRSAADTKAAGGDDRTFRDKPMSTIGPINRSRDRETDRWGGGNNPAGEIAGAQARWKIGSNAPSGGVLKPKDLCMIPNRFAIALQEAGWWVRSEIIWAKPNPMPESVRDRPATSHEKIFMFSKSPKYFYNALDSRVEGSSNGKNFKVPDGWDTGPGAHGSIHKRGRDKGDKHREAGPRHSNPDWNHKQLDDVGRGEGRNLRNWEAAPVQVWEIATHAFSEAHFATFPPELVLRCLTAGCPAGGMVLDPFGGSGTTGMVADQLGMNAHLIELNEEYCRIAWCRIKNNAPMLADIEPQNFDLFGDK